MSIADYGFAIWETFYVTVLSTAFSLVIGLPLGVLLVAGDKDGVLPLPGWLMHLLNIIINILRSVPFLILMICVFPLTRLIVGTTVGTKATIVPLVVEAMQVATHGLADGCREHFYDRWCPAVEHWGGRPHMTAHSCRHTLATAMEAAGVQPLLQKLILGHAVRDITQHYSRHQLFADKLAAVELATATFNE